MFGTTGLQVTGTELLHGAVDPDRSPGSGSVTSSTGHGTLRPRAPRLLGAFRQSTATCQALLGSGSGVRGQG